MPLDDWMDELEGPSAEALKELELEEEADSDVAAVDEHVYSELARLSERLDAIEEALSERGLL